MRALTEDIDCAIEGEIESIDLNYSATFRAQNSKYLKDSLIYANIIDVDKGKITSGQHSKLVCPLHLENQLTAYKI